jgi:hypothetical protein
MVNTAALPDHDSLLAGHYYAGFQVQPRTLPHILDHLAYSLHNACIMEEMHAFSFSVKQQF